MKRRDFISLAGMGTTAAFLTGFTAKGMSVSEQRLLEEFLDAKEKKRMADIALNAAKAKGATYTDVRIGRYLNQSVLARDRRVQGVANTESFGIGIRVIANGSWGFAASEKMDNASIAKTAELAVAIAKGNAKLLTEPVQLAPQKGFGEVSWKTPIEKNAFEIPVKEKVDLLLSVNEAALSA
ncbi:MAG: hypothetical protein J7527_06645, partial [Chitinophagaceae bacterium]|nr:hypothetical protein [Chitinophagaceae bacterium]